MPSLVVGVDFGTTSTGTFYFCLNLWPTLHPLHRILLSRKPWCYLSGFAWAEIPADGSHKAGDLNPEPEIMYFQGSSNAKVPTALCYCSSRRQPGRDYVWGEEVSPKDSKESHCSGTPYQHFKIQLEGTTTSSTHGILEPTGTCVNEIDTISPSTLVVDYLSAIRKEFMKNLVEKYGRLHAEGDFAIDWIFTVPRLFSEKLIQELRDNYLPKAGFTGTITHITEPHAAAVHILSHSQSQAPNRRLFAKNNSIFKVRINGLRDQSARYGV